MYFEYIVQTMCSLAFFSPNLIWSILDIVYEHTQMNKVLYILMYDSILDMGVTTPRDRKYLLYTGYVEHVKSPTL
jgi:hypothetical protein